MKHAFFFISFFLFSNCIYSQNINLNSIYQEKEINYFGWDFNQVRVFDPRLVGKENEIKAKIGVILGNLSSVYTSKKLSKELRKVIVPHFNDIQNKYSKRDVSTLITYSEYEIKKDELEIILKNYNLKDSTGIGFVIIPENMNAPEEYTSTLYVFFDIKTRVIISNTKVNTFIKGGKFTKYWFNSFSNSYKFWLKDFKKELKTFN